MCTGAGATRFRRRFRLGGFGAEGSDRFNEGSGEGLGGFGAEPGHVQQGSGEGSGEGSGKGLEALVPKKVPGRMFREALVPESGAGGFGAEFRSKFRTGFQEALVQSQVRLNRVPEKVPEKVPGGTLLQSQVKVQQGSGEGSRERLGGFGAETDQVQQDLRPFIVIHGNPQKSS